MVFKFHFDFGIMRTSDDLFSQSLRLKRHDYESQHPYLRQTLDISYCCLSKDIGFYRVPICQLHDLRCALMNCCLPLITNEPVFAEYYAKKRAEGKHYRVALTHVAKKLLRVIYTMQTKNIRYDSTMIR